MSNTRQGAERPVQMGHSRTIDAGIGTIRWSSNNLQLMAIMEALEEKLKSHSPNSITSLIEGMKK